MLARGFAASTEPAMTTPIVVATSAPLAKTSSGVFKTRALRPASCIVPVTSSTKLTRRAVFGALG